MNTILPCFDAVTSLDLCLMFDVWASNQVQMHLPHLTSLHIDYRYRFFPLTAFVARNLRMLKVSNSPYPSSRDIYTVWTKEKASYPPGLPRNWFPCLESFTVTNEYWNSEGIVPFLVYSLALLETHLTKVEVVKIDLIYTDSRRPPLALSSLQFFLQHILPKGAEDFGPIALKSLDIDCSFNAAQMSGSEELLNDVGQRIQNVFLRCSDARLSWYLDEGSLEISRFAKWKELHRDFRIGAR